MGSAWRFMFKLWLNFSEPVYQGGRNGRHSWLVPLISGRADGPMLTGQLLPGGSELRTLCADGRLACDARFALQCAGQRVQVRQAACWRSGPGDETDEQAATQLQLHAPPGWLAHINRQPLAGRCRASGRDGTHVEVEVFALNDSWRRTSAINVTGQRR